MPNTNFRESSSFLHLNRKNWQICIDQCSLWAMNSRIHQKQKFDLLYPFFRDKSSLAGRFLKKIQFYILKVCFAVHNSNKSSYIPFWSNVFKINITYSGYVSRKDVHFYLIRPKSTSIFASSFVSYGWAIDIKVKSSRSYVWKRFDLIKSSWYWLEISWQVSDGIHFQ